MKLRYTGSRTGRDGAVTIQAINLDTNEPVELSVGTHELGWLQFLLAAAHRQMSRLLSLHDGGEKAVIHMLRNAVRPEVAATVVRRDLLTGDIVCLLQFPNRAPLPMRFTGEEADALIELRHTAPKMVVSH